MKRKSSNKNFGIVFFIFFGMLFVYFFIKKNQLNYILALSSFGFLFLGLINSKILTPLNNFWTKFGLFLGKIANPVILLVIYCVTVIPVGLLMKLLKKDLLEINIKKHINSYWVEKKNKSSMNNQF